MMRVQDASGAFLRGWTHRYSTYFWHGLIHSNAFGASVILRALPRRRHSHRCFSIHDVSCWWILRFCSFEAEVECSLPWWCSISGVCHHRFKVSYSISERNDASVTWWYVDPSIFLFCEKHLSFLDIREATFSMLHGRNERFFMRRLPARVPCLSLTTSGQGKFWTRLRARPETIASKRLRSWSFCNCFVVQTFRLHVFFRKIVLFAVAMSISFDGVLLFRRGLKLPVLF